MFFRKSFVPSNPIGQKGESLAASYLEKKAGLKILKRNWRCASGEIDLVAQDPGGAIIFVEVKTRSYDAENAWESLTPAKRKLLHRLALAYLRMHGLPLETAIRFDFLIANKKGVLLHEQDAFEAESEL